MLDGSGEVVMLDGSGKVLSGLKDANIIGARGSRDGTDEERIEEKELSDSANWETGNRRPK